MSAATDTTPLTLDEERTAADLLDTVAPPACDWEVVAPYSEKCQTPATWALVLSCGHTFCYCDEHRAAVDDYITEPPVGIACKASGHRPREVTHLWRTLS